MDPNETLRLLRLTLDAAFQCADEGSAAGAALAVMDARDYLSDLDEWLSKGGFLPDAWKR